MPAGNINSILELWAASLAKHNTAPPFRNHADLYDTIDSTPLGGVNWESFHITYNGPLPDGDAPPWMTDEHSVFFRDPLTIAHNMLANPEFKGEIDFAPLREYSPGTRPIRRLHNFMGGEWAWNQAVSKRLLDTTRTHNRCIGAHPLHSGHHRQGSCMRQFCAGPDHSRQRQDNGVCSNRSKRVLSAIRFDRKCSQQRAASPPKCGCCHCIPCYSQEYVLSSHRMRLTPRSDHYRYVANKRDDEDPHFRKFRRQLFHSSLSRILRSLRPWMEKPEIVRCGDGHFRKVVYSLGPYIADYPEQALLACIVQNWCPM